MKYTNEIARETKDPKILIEILRKWKAYNPNCPPEILVEILRREKDDYVSWTAARHPNCPPEARIKWMQLTGKIEKEDPSKHIIEYENNKEDDLSDLKDLL